MDINKYNTQISTLIDKRRLREAFKALRSLLASYSDPKLSDRLDSLEKTYRYMIHYMVEGYVDAGREGMLDSIVAELRTVNDIIRRNAMLPDSPDIYSSTKRFENIRKATLGSRLDAYRESEAKRLLAEGTDTAAVMTKEADDALLALFSFIWTMFGAPAADYKLLSDTVKSPNFPFNAKSQVISALLLGNLTYFDRNALTALIDIYEADIDPKISARALVAVFLVVAANPKRVAEDPSLKARLSLWQDSIMTYPRLREVLMNIIRSRDTERISNKMQNEVFPELMKLRPEIVKKLRKITEEADMEMLEENPEWEELLNKNGLGEKLKSLTEIQMEGGDVMMLAFSNLKSFPFFNNVANWFLPFSSTHSDVAPALGNDASSFSGILDMEGVMCDSDKYSFAFSLQRMPEAQRKMMSEQMTGQLQQFKEAMADRQLKSSVPEFDSEVTRYVRNIYRFFKLYRRKQDFSDPFANPVDFSSLPYLSDILSDPEIMKLVGEFYFKRGYYAEALPILLTLEKDSESDDSVLLWEKIGYCYNALKDLENAMIWYRKAELINPDSKWLIKKLAMVFRMLGRHEEAVEYYTRALETDPDNYTLLMSAGNCLLEADRPSEALTNYYHADYIKPDRLSTLRAIAWGELLNGNKEKSLEYYKRLLESEKATSTDRLNAAHVYYLSGNLKRAVELYTECARDPNYGMEKLEKAMTEDLPVIEKSGGNRQELNMLLDSVGFGL